MRKITFFCLMPIGKFDTVYSKGIKTGIHKLSEELRLSLDVKRADLDGSGEEVVMNRIISGIVNRDIMIIDITGLNSNVMWELGYCKALGKISIVITQDKYEDIPFNIRQEIIYRYKFQNDEMRLINSEYPTIEKLIKHKINILIRKSSFLSNDKQFQKLVNLIEKGTNNIHVNSILGTSINLKLEALVEEIKQIDKWRFGIYHQKAKESLKFLFTKVIESLRSGDRYYTISFVEFWDEVSQGGIDWSFIEKNAAAAEEGVEIKRLIIIDAKKYDRDSISKNMFLQKVLDNHSKLKEQYPKLFDSKILFVNDHNHSIPLYKNFVLIKRKDEEIVLKTHRNIETQSLETELIYLNLEEVNHLEYERHETIINKFKERFHNHWKNDKCEEL